MTPKKDLHAVAEGRIEKARKSAANVRHKVWDLELIKTRVVKQFEGWANSKRLGTAAGDRAIQFVVSETKAKASSFVSQGHQHAVEILAAIPATLLLQSKEGHPQRWVDALDFSPEGLASCLDGLSKFGMEVVKQCAENTAAEKLLAHRLFYEQFAQTMQDKFEQGWRLNPLLEAFGSAVKFPEPATAAALPVCTQPPQLGIAPVLMVQASNALTGLSTPETPAVATALKSGAVGVNTPAPMPLSIGITQPDAATPSAQQPNVADPSIDATLQASPAAKATITTPITLANSQTQFSPGITNPTPANTPASTSKTAFPFLANVPSISAPAPAVTSPSLRIAQVVKALALPPNLVDPTLRARLQQLVPKLLPSPETALAAIREARLTLPETTNLMTAAPIGSALQIVAADCLNTMLRVQALLANEVARQQAQQQARQGQASQGVQSMPGGEDKPEQSAGTGTDTHLTTGATGDTAKPGVVTDTAQEAAANQQELPTVSIINAFGETSAEAVQKKDVS